MILTPQHLDILCHSLGLTEDGRGREYRNYYVSGGGIDERLITEMVDAGLMYEGRASTWSCGRVFHVSDEGKKQARSAE